LPISFRQTNPAAKPWLQQWERYLAGLPPYYVPVLRAALVKRGVAGAVLVPEQFAGALKHALAVQLGRAVAAAKTEFERIMAAPPADKQQPGTATATPTPVEAATPTTAAPEGALRLAPASFLEADDAAARVRGGLFF
jgi:hypothetical protein